MNKAKELAVASIESNPNIDINKIKKFRILKLVSMFLYLIVQYIDRSRVLMSTTVFETGREVFFWAMECISLCSINVFVLSTAFELVGQKFTVSRAIKTWLEVFFYSLLFAIIAVCRGQANPNEVFGIYNIYFYIFPISSNHFWFASSYVVLLLLAPILNKAVEGITKRHFNNLLRVMFLLFSILPTLCPAQLAIDDSGRSVVWFIFVYLLAVYLDKYGIPWVEKWPVLLYLVAVVVSSIWQVVSGIIVDGFTGQYEGLGYVLDVPRHNNFVFTLLASVAVVAFVKNRKDRENKVVSFFARLGECAFGIYLIEDHLFNRNKWTKMIVFGEGNEPLILHFVVSVICMFVACILIDYLRSLLFEGFRRCYGKLRKNK